MTRQYPETVHIGQRVLAYPNPTAHPMTAYITGFDTLKGMVRITLAHKKGEWMARPRAIVSAAGQYLHFEGGKFIFCQHPQMN